MNKANIAGIGGDTRSGLGTKSMTSARPTNCQAGLCLAQKRNASFLIEMMQDVRKQDDVEVFAPIYLKEISRQCTVSPVNSRFLRIRARYVRTSVQSSAVTKASGSDFATSIP